MLHFYKNYAKTRNTPLGTHLKFSKRQSSQTEEEESHMSKVSYASTVGSLMYVMVCTRPDIAHAVGVVSRFLSNPGNEHWEGVKWILRYLKAHQRCICLLKEVISLYRGFLMQIWEVIWMVERAQQVTFLRWVVQLLVGSLNFKEESRSQPLKLNM